MSSRTPETAASCRASFPSRVRLSSTLSFFPPVLAFFRFPRNVYVSIGPLSRTNICRLSNSERSLRFEFAGRVYGLSHSHQLATHLFQGNITVRDHRWREMHYSYGRVHTGLYSSRRLDVLWTCLRRSRVRTYTLAARAKNLPGVDTLWPRVCAG